jgi:hypothetical protein
MNTIRKKTETHPSKKETVDNKVTQLLNQMTLDEKLKMIHG